MCFATYYHLLRRSSVLSASLLPHFHTSGSRNPMDNPSQVPSPLRSNVLPSKASVTSQASSALFAMGPGLSNESVSVNEPRVSWTPTVGLMAYRAARLAGVMMDPIVSAPMAMGLKPVATATADPVEEPPGLWFVCFSGNRRNTEWLNSYRVPEDGLAICNLSDIGRERLATDG